MRLLVFAPYFAPHVGGVESFVAELDEELLRGPDPERVTVLAPRLPPEGEPVEDRGPRHRIVRYPAVEPIPNFPVPALWRAGFWRALRAARPRAHEVFVSHTRFFPSSALALVLARLTGRRLLHVEHGSDYVQLGSRLTGAAARLYDHTLGRQVLRRADAVVAVSHAAAAFVHRLAGREATVLHRGVDGQVLAAVVADPRVRAQARGRPVAMFVGRLIDGKGVADLVRAFAAVTAPEALLCLVGDGPRRAELERLASDLGVAERVLFLGYLVEAQALAAIRAADVVVNPSYTEGLPTAVLEAAGLGRAVLATDVGGTREIVTPGRSGVLVAPRDIDALARELGRLLADGALRERLGAAAQAEVRGRFDWEASARSFRALVEGLNAR